MSTELEAILDAGNPEQIDDILSKMDAGMSEEEAIASIESGDTGGEQAPADPTPDQDAPAQEAKVQEPVVEPEPEPTPVTEPDAGAAAAEKEATPQEEKESVVLTKDGKHEIPYSVLEEQRREAAAARSQAEELARKNALLEAQLADADIKPKDLPENVRFTPEQLKDFESYGEIGEAVAVLAQQNDFLQQRLEQANLAPNPAGVDDAGAVQPDTNPLAANPDTMRWAESDTHWNVVESVNNSLEIDPAWREKTLAERVPEIVRRTKLALGEAADKTIDDAAAQALEGSERTAPNSLTDVGGEVPGREKSITQQLEDGDISDVEGYLAKEVAKGRNMDDVLASLLPAT